MDFVSLKFVLVSIFTMTDLFMTTDSLASGSTGPSSMRSTGSSGTSRGWQKWWLFRNGSGESNHFIESSHGVNWSPGMDFEPPPPFLKLICECSFFLGTDTSFVICLPRGGNHHFTGRFKAQWFNTISQWGRKKDRRRGTLEHRNTTSSAQLCPTSWIRRRNILSFGDSGHEREALIKATVGMPGEKWAWPWLELKPPFGHYPFEVNFRSRTKEIHQVSMKTWRVQRISSIC